MPLLALFVGALLVAAIVAYVRLVRIPRARELRRQGASWQNDFVRLRAGVGQVGVELLTFHMALEHHLMLDAASRGEKIPFRNYVGPTGDAAREAARQQMMESWSEINTRVDRLPALMRTAAVVRPDAEYWTEMSAGITALRARTDRMHALLDVPAADLDPGAILGSFGDLKSSRVLLSLRLERLPFPFA